jgi:hypothetical protein
MYGYWYSVKENYSFSKQELTELLWTALAFSFCITSYYADLFVVADDIRIVISDTLIGYFIVAFLVIFASLYAHIALQKLVGIRLGYVVKYSYWLNGIFLGLFLSVITLGKVPIISVFILPGAVILDHIPKLRLGKFRYGINTKDIARVSLAGPLSHVLIVTFLGLIFFATDKSPFVASLITANLLLMLYSVLPIPKVDSPIRMDSASDGLGLFFYARWVYVLCALTFLFYALLIWISTVFSFVMAFLLAGVVMIIYSVVLKK